MSVNVSIREPLLRSSAVGESIDSACAASSSVIVPVPVAVPIVALVALLRVTLRVSLRSPSVSPITDTLKVWLVVPGAKVSVPSAMAV